MIGATRRGDAGTAFSLTGLQTFSRNKLQDKQQPKYPSKQKAKI
jgi:hypothetical protein